MDLNFFPLPLTKSSTKLLKIANSEFQGHFLDFSFTFHIVRNIYW